MEKLRQMWVYINFWRVVPAFMFFKMNRFEKKCSMDLTQWLDNTPHLVKEKQWFQFGYSLLMRKECRNIFLNRLHRNPVMYLITRLLFKPLDSCYINMPPEKIGGGFALQHGFSTIIAAQEIGEWCKVNQQVTIGYNGEECPVIGNHVTITAGAIVIGKVYVGDWVTVGAGAVVVHDVPAHATAVGVPARSVIK